MTNFYKGGRELSKGKDSSGSPEIKSKKIRVQLPELLASFQLFFTHIFQVCVKHYLSTDIALFTQSLRRKIDNGKMYYKGTCPVLQKRLQSSDQKITKQEISSGVLRALFGWPSDLLRTCVGPSSGVLRLLFGCSSGRSRSAVEADSKPSRSVAEHVSNKPRRGPEALPKSTRRRVGASPSSDLCLTNFAPTSAFHAVGHQSSSNFPLIFPVGDPKPTRRNSEQRWEKGRSWSGVGRYLNGLFLGTKGTVSSPLSYRECTERVPKRYWECTKELPEIYQRGIKQVRAVSSSLVDLGYKSDTAVAQSAKGEDTELDNGREGSCFKFNGFKTFYERVVSVIDSFIVDVVSKAQRALKCFAYLFDNKNTFRMSLTCLALVFRSSNFSFKALKSIRALMVLALMVSMFSLSAQTPRKDSGADGLSDLTALKPGDKIPDAVWNQSLELNYFNGKKKTIRFSDLKGKLILLDFWSTGCPSCIEGIPDMELIQQRFKDKVKVVMVNSKRNKDTPERINKRFKKYKEDFNYTPVLPTLLDDTLFTSLLPHNTLPTIGIISAEGQFVLNSFASSVTEDIIQDFLKTGVSNRFIEKSEIKNTARINTQPLVDTTGLVFCSVMSGYRENYLGVYPAVSYSKGSSLFQVGNYFLNTCYQLAFPDVFQGAKSSLFVFDDRINKEFIDLIYDFKTTKGQFWYQLYLRDSITQELAFDYFRKALIERFHVTVERKKGVVEAYALSLDESRPLWKTKGGMYINSVDKGNESLILQNVPINGVISFIRSILDKPVIFEHKSAERIDLRLPGNFLDLTIEEKVAVLEQHGIKLKPAEYNGEYPYFYSVSTLHTK
ncbi:TlpA family protein disulfide reductase [Sphingobacterium athyrii]|uniref:Thioredoxin domain-containing protein n=1 Tax=Sphingobacterium athyrii TaxID=2152717 RepID=A0A363NKU7_9SPHI|nr:TlpA family protein disulfide reductase [Sphingobacterium athyrii]PUV21446.1 hypothetical protein DCO56_26945 [Sphingobacterium athyrii]